MQEIIQRVLGFVIESNVIISGEKTVQIGTFCTGFTIVDEKWIRFNESYNADGINIIGIMMYRYQFHWIIEGNVMIPDPRPVRRKGDTILYLKPSEQELIIWIKNQAILYQLDIVFNPLFVSWSLLPRVTISQRISFVLNVSWLAILIFISLRLNSYWWISLIVEFIWILFSLSVIRIKLVKFNS